MRIELLPGRSLPPELARRWAELARSQTSLRDPFLTPDFTRAVSDVRRDVEVAVLEEHGAVVGFFPFQRSAWNIGRPVGSRLSDLHAVIAEPGWTWRPAELVRGCRLSAWEFFLLAAAPPGLEAHGVQQAESLFADLSNGFEHYRNQRRQAGSEKFKQLAKFARRAEREVGPQRFVYDTRDPAVVAQLLAWKTDQYRRTGAVNVFAFDWVVELLHRILDCTGMAFCGTLSALYFADRLAAVELSLRSHEVLHGWFSAYNPEFSKYSPGALLAVQIAQAAEPLGIHRIEWGKNNLAYKESFVTGSYPVAKGAVVINPLLGACHRGHVAARRLAETEFLRGTKRLVRRVFHPACQWLALR